MSEQAEPKPERQGRRRVTPSQGSTDEQPALPAAGPVTTQIPLVPQDASGAELMRIASSLLQVGQDLVYPVARQGVTPETLGSAFTRVDSAAKIYVQVSDLLRQIQQRGQPA